MRSDRIPAIPWSVLGAPARLLRPLVLGLRARPRLGHLALRLVPNLVVPVRLRELGRLRIRLRQHRSLWLRDPWVAERVPFAMLRAMVRPGDLVYDVGANLGLYTRLFAILGSGGVVAFEPVASNRELYRRNTAAVAQGLDRGVRCLGVALADRDEEADFQLDDMQSTSGTLDRVTGGAPSEGRRNLGLAPRTERVACRRLDSLVDAGEIPPPDLMKIDVEGAEELVLLGGRAVLERHRPRLMVELHGAEVARRVGALLLDLGYSCRAAVLPEVDPSGFAPVTRELLARVRGLYDLHFLAASHDPADLPERL